MGSMSDSASGRSDYQKTSKGRESCRRIVTLNRSFIIYNLLVFKQV